MNTKNLNAVMDRIERLADVKAKNVMVLRNVNLMLDNEKLKNKELTEAYEKLRLHCNKLAADKKQAVKELEHFEELEPGNEALRARILELESAVKDHPDFVGFYKDWKA